MFWSFGPSLSGITANLKSENCSLEEILLDSTLQQAIRSSLRELIDFISRDDIFNDLFDWVLTNNHKDNKNHQKLARNALLIVTSNSQTIQKVILNHQLFVERIQSFINQNSNDELINDSRIAGHFQRIIELYAVQTNGKIINQLKSLPTFLIHNMTILGLRELFILLATQFIENFGLTNENIEELTKETKNADGYFVTTAIKSIIEKAPVLINQHFQNPNIVKNLLEAAASNKENNHLVTIELCKTLCIIFNNCSNIDELQALLAEYSGKFIKEDMEINCSTASIISLFKSLNDKIFDQLFCKPTNTFLNQNIIEILKNMSDEQKDALLKNFNAPSKLLKFYNKYTANGQLYDLYKIIKETYKLPTPDLPKESEESPNENSNPNENPNSNENSTEQTDSKTEQEIEKPKFSIQLPDGWDDLTITIEEANKLLETGYGGPVPTCPNTFSSDSDDELIPEQSSSSDEFFDDEEEDSEDPEFGEEEEEAEDKSYSDEAEEEENEEKKDNQEPLHDNL